MIRESLLPQGDGPAMAGPRCFPETDGSSVPAPFGSAGGSGRFGAHASAAEDATYIPWSHMPGHVDTVDVAGSGSFFTPASVGPWVDIYLSAGVEDGGASCHHDNQATCGLYRVRWDLGLERAVEVERLFRPTRDADGTEYGHVEAAVSDDGDLTWLLRGYRASGGTAKGSYLLHLRSGATFFSVLDFGTAVADRPQFPWFYHDDSVIYSKHDGGETAGGQDWNSLWWVRVGDRPYALVGRGPETYLNGGGSEDVSYGNPQAAGGADLRIVTFGVDLDSSGEASDHPNPHVTFVNGRGREDFSLGGGSFKSCQHPAWSLDGTRIACTRHEKPERASSGGEVRALFEFTPDGSTWESQGRLFKPADPAGLPSPFPEVSCDLLTYKQAHWCGDATHVVATVFCTDPADRTIPPSMSRVLLINFKDPQNPIHYDVTAAVVAAFREEGGNRRWRGIFSVCRNAG